MFDRFFQWLAYNRTVSALNKLSDKELKDIGITRGEIVRVAREKIY